MPPIESFIIGSEKVTKVYGRWPSFHDAEVVQVRLSRGSVEDGKVMHAPPELEAKLHTWEGTSEVDAAGYYVTRHHLLITLRFRDLQEDMHLAGFNCQNVISDLCIETLEPNNLAPTRFSVAFRPCYGIAAAFTCGGIEVVEAVPVERDD